ncbi:vacuolar-sorting receptor 1 [Fagus crenata]
MEQADQFFWFNEEQYYKDGGFYNAEQQYFQGGSTSDYGHGLKISEAVNYCDGGLYNDMHQFQDDSDIETASNSLTLDLDPEENTITCVAETNQNSGQDEVQAKVSKDFKMKALHFRAQLLRIDEWQEVAAPYEESLMVKCYFGKEKFIWEILQKNSTLKKKIEIDWSDISAIRSRTVQHEQHELGVLEIELKNPPSFYEEVYLQPQKYTIWNMTSDFTNGQALIYRRHYLEFQPGFLKKYYDKLIKCPDLFKLNQEPFPSLSSPYFNSNFSSATMPLVGMQQV